MKVQTKKKILNFLRRRLQTLSGMNGANFVINTAKAYHSN